MDIRERRALKAAAGESLAQASYDPKKLILIHTGCILVLSLILTLIDYLLEQQIGTTGGLSGMGTRSMLSTIQSVLRLAQSIALPFWQIGYTFVALKLAKREQLHPMMLTEGFRRFGPVLRLLLIQGMLYFAVALVCSYAASILLLLTPWGSPLLAEMTELMNSSSMLEDTAAIQEAILAAMDSATVPLMIIFSVLFLIAVAPLYYRYRMSEFVLMEDPSIGAFSAMKKSWSMTKGNCLNLLKLDLSFWWFYLLDGLVTLVCYGDLILEALNVSLPFSATAGSFLFFGLYLVCQLALYWWRRNELEVTYAHAYTALQIPQAPKPQPAPKQPWVY